MGFNEKEVAFIGELFLFKFKPPKNAVMYPSIKKMTMLLIT